MSEALMSFLTVFVGSKVAAGALAAGALAAGGTGAAAYTGALPDALQQGAHDVIGAPAPRTAGPLDADERKAAGKAHGPKTASAAPSATPAGPDATGPAAYGLCEAYTRGGLDASSTAYASLATAAKGASKIVTYCAGIASPGESADHRTTPSEHAAPRDEAKGDANAKPEADIPAVPGTKPVLPAQAATGASHKPSTAGRP
jgi:hypothetical protein